MVGSGSGSHYIEWIAEAHNGRAACMANYMPADVIVINNSTERILCPMHGRVAPDSHYDTWMKYFWYVKSEILKYTNKLLLQKFSFW